jgi:hypothetical protein
MDLKVIEDAGNGGDLVRKGNDLSVIEGLQNMPYLAMFGGNVAANTTNKRIVTEQDFSWWGNAVLFPNNENIQFNSNTERILMTTPLTTRGRTLIEQAVKTDLLFMKEFCRVAVAVSIVATDKVVIGVRLQEPDNLQQRDFLFIWDATRSELTQIKDGNNGNAPAPPSSDGFDYDLDFDFI